MSFYNDSPFEDLEETPHSPKRDPESGRPGGRKFFKLLGAMALVFILGIVVIVFVVPFLQTSRQVAEQEQLALASAASTATSYASTNEAYAGNLTAVPVVTTEPTAAPSDGEPTAEPPAGEPTSAVVVVEPTAVAVVVEPTAVPSVVEPTAVAVVVEPTVAPSADEASSPTAEVIITETPIPSVVNTEETGFGGPALLDADQTATVSVLLTRAAGEGGDQAMVQVTSINVQATSLPQTGLAQDIGLPGLIGMAALLIFVVFLARKLRTSMS